jgi:hypothetical protein
MKGNFIGDELDIFLVVDLVKDLLALGIHRTQVAMVQVHGPVSAHQRQMVGVEGAEGQDLLQMAGGVVAGNLHR